MKLPGQHRGKVVRRHVRNIDITPTIARVAGLRPRWRVQGRSLIGPPARRIPGPKAIFDKGGARVPLGSLATLRRRMTQSLKRKLSIFGKAGAFGIGPHRELHGTQVTEWAALPQSALRAQIDSPAQFRGVQLGSPVPPVKVTGRLVGPGSDSGLDLAIAVNGTIEATAPAFKNEGTSSYIFSALFPNRPSAPVRTRCRSSRSRARARRPRFACWAGRSQSSDEAATAASASDSSTRGRSASVIST